MTGVEVERDGQRSTIACRFVIDASGQARVVGRQLGIPSETSELGDLSFHAYLTGFHWDEALFGTPS